MNFRTVGPSKGQGQVARMPAWLFSVVVLCGVLWCAWTGSASAAEELRWRFQTGESLRYTMVQDIVQTTKGQGRDLKLTMNQTVDLHWTVKSVSSEGVADLTWTIDRVRAKVSVPGRELDFDSASGKDPEGPLAAQLVPLLKAIVGAEFTLKMNARGEYSDVTVPQNVVDSLRRGGPGEQAGAADPGEGLKNLINQVNLVLPAKPLEKGDAWTSKSRFPMPMLGTVVWDKRFTFDGPEPKDPGLRKISLDTKISLEPAADSTVAVKITSSQRVGEYAFDPQAGRIVSSRVKETLEMSFSAQGFNTVQTTQTETTMTLGKDGGPK